MGASMAEAALVGGAYLVGTFPTAALVARGQGRDPTREGSGNPGATNVYRIAGPRAGAMVLVGDLVKGMVPTAVALTVFDRRLAVVTALAAVIGHCWPATRGFKGGKGVATAGGAVLVLEPLVGLVGAILWLLVAKVARKASLASIATALMVPSVMVALGRPAWELGGVAILVLIVVARHADNISRLRSGDERSLQEEGGR
ncbi:MAG TPA: glycerol-3-phosphate 1-O-acyltransferase PlsY [Acidimicrobiales bacterium]|nr:glycerol-3-phosphate 1-O-acyltransferase PlsY [Acidimicrobiales bacterium]